MNAAVHAKSYLARRVANAELLVLGVLGWIAFAFLTIVTVAAGWELTKGGVRQVDWHVYVAGAQDLLAHRLYAVALDLGGLVLSATQFNLPPLSAVWAVPLLPLPIEVGGEVWQLIAAASIAITAVLTALIVGVRRPLLAAGAILGPLSFNIVYLEGLHLGTNNYLVLAMVGASPGSCCAVETDGPDLRWAWRLGPRVGRWPWWCRWSASADGRCWAGQRQHSLSRRSCSWSGSGRAFRDGCSRRSERFRLQRASCWGRHRSPACIRSGRPEGDWWSP